MKKVAFILFLLSATILKSQLPVNPGQYSLKQIKSFGQNAVRLDDIYVALDFYKYYCAKKTDDYGALFQLAELYRKTRDYNNALAAYSKVMEHDARKYPEAEYYHALILMNMEKYDSASVQFEHFRKVYRNPRDRYFKKMAAVQIEGCTRAKKMIDSALNITLIHLPKPINHGHIDFSPFPIDSDRLIYSTLQLDSVILYDPYDTTMVEPQRRLMVASRVKNEWMLDTSVHLPFNAAGLHTANAVYSTDKKRAYISRCGRNWQNKMICSIYQSFYEMGHWTEPKMLPYPVNDANYTSSMPAVAVDPKTKWDVLYFVSDREKGHGGTDIWYTRYNQRKNTWEAPKNAGGKINTIGDEASPFYDYSTHTMYFSSDGYPGLGGMDIFKTVGSLKNWTPPQNAGFPLNSAYDDLCYSISPSRKEGFLVSNRTGVYALKNPNCCDDIFQYKHNKYIKLGITGRVFDIAESDIMEKLNAKFNLGLDINLEDRWAPGILVDLYYLDEFKNKVKIKSDSTKEDGSYYFDVEVNNKYQVAVKNYGYFDKIVKLSTKNKDESDTIELKKVGINYIPDKPLVFNVYFDFGKYHLTQRAKEAIDTSLLEILNELPQIVVEISTHTDSVGDDEANLVLSQNRAEAIVKYLIHQGIQPERLVAKGYGETSPIVSNTNPDGTDNEEGRRRNRRGEIRILGSLEQFINKDEENDESDE